MPTPHYLRRAAPALLLGLAALLASCGSSNPHGHIDVKVLVRPNGDSEVEVTPSGVTADPATLSGQVAAVISIGTPKGSPTVDGQRGTTQLTGGTTDRVVVDIDTIRHVVQTGGITTQTGLFVSLCTPAREGTAAGTHASTGHWGSCASYSTDAIGTATTGATLAVAFGRRSTPQPPSTLWLVAIAVLVVAAAAVAARTRDRKRRRLLVAAGVILIVVAVIVVLAVAFGTGVSNDGWLVHGTTFDHDITNSFRSFILLGVLLGVALPVLALAAGLTIAARRPAPAPAARRGPPSGRRRPPAKKKRKARRR